MRKLKSLAFAIGLACTAGAASADVLFESSAFSNITNPAVNAWCSSCGGNWQVFDSFSLGASSTISGTNFAIQSSYGPNNHTIAISIWDSTRTTQLFSQTVSSGSYTRTDLANDVSLISASLAGPSLSAGSYYMSWYDAQGMGIPGYNGGNSLIQRGTSGDQLRGHVAAFQVIGAVPEPETYAMLLAGLGILGAVARRRKAIR